MKTTKQACGLYLAGSNKRMAPTCLLLIGTTFLSCKAIVRVVWFKEGPASHSYFNKIFIHFLNEPARLHWSDTKFV